MESYGLTTLESNNKFDIDLSYGMEMEDKLKKIFKGDIQLEVKRNRYATRTGNIAVELCCNGRPSGYLVSEADYWYFHIDELDSGILISKKRLGQLMSKYRYNITLGGDKYKSVMTLIPISEVFK